MARKLQLAWQRQSELTSNVSHELRSPLARLKIALELARRKTGELPELDRIDVETEKLDVLIGQLLTFSRLDSREGNVAERVDIGELVENVVNDVRFEFGDVGIELHNADGVSVDGYSHALRSAVENVLRNAALHGRENVQVSVSAEVSSAVITVSDSGGGVPDEALKHLFDAFYRATSSGETTGTGLGLAIATRAIAMHKGTIAARNANGGLLVEMRLPL